VPSSAFKAVIARRPTVIDGFAWSIAKRLVGDQVNSAGMNKEVRAKQELRLADRITESIVGRGLHSSTCRLNVSALCGIGGCVWGLFRGV